MVGLMDGHQMDSWTGKECPIVFSLGGRGEKSKEKGVHWEHTLISSVTAFHPWCYGFMGEENGHIPAGSANVARFSSLSIVPL